MAYLPPATGEYRHQIRIERQTVGKDKFGNPTQSWEVTFDKIAAAIAVTKGGEEIRSMRASGISRFDIVLRIPTASITIGDRMIDETGTAYDILWVGDLEGKGRQINMIAQIGGLND